MTQLHQIVGFPRCGVSQSPPIPRSVICFLDHLTSPNTPNTNVGKPWQRVTSCQNTQVKPCLSCLFLQLKWKAADLSNVAELFLD